MMDNIYTATQSGGKYGKYTLWFAHKKSFIYFVDRNKAKTASSNVTLCSKIVLVELWDKNCAAAPFVNLQNFGLRQKL